MTDEPFQLIEVKKIIPHIPYYLTDGNHSHTYHWEDFVDRLGNKAKIKIVKYLSKKNKPLEAVIQVVWEEK